MKFLSLGLCACMAFVLSASVYAMDGKRKEKIQQKYEQILKDSSAILQELKGEAEKVKDATKEKVSQEVGELEQKQKKLDSDLAELKKSSGSAWDELQKSFEKAAHELKDGLNKAKKKLKGSDGK